MSGNRAEHHRILVFVGAMMSAFDSDGKYARPPKTPRFRCAKPLFRSASLARKNLSLQRVMNAAARFFLSID
jgi:hypothetical protein